MLVKALRTFRFKSNLYQKGMEIEVSKEEADNIMSAFSNPLVEVLKEETEAEQVDYSSYTKKELISMAKDKGVELDSKMTKAEIVRELMK